MTTIRSSMANFGRHLRWLSLDVVAGALSMGYFAAWITDSVIPWAWYPILAMSVWVVYTLDHLSDARRLGAAASTERHLFHHRNSRLLMVIISVFGLTAIVWSMYTFDRFIILCGMVLGMLSLLYFLAVNGLPYTWRRFIPKELIVGVIYLAGIFLVPVDGALVVNKFGLGMLFISLLLLVVGEGSMAAWYDHDIDRHDQQPSLSQFAGKPGARILIYLMILASAAAAIMLLLHSTAPSRVPASVMLLLMNGILTLLISFPGTFGKHQRFSLWGELLFLLPGCTALIFSFL